MKRNLKNLILFLIICMTTSLLPIHAEELEETITLAVSPLFTITKNASSIESATVNPATGIHSGLRLVYDMVTNGTDEDYYVTVTSAINTQGGVLSGFGNDGSLMFTNDASLPTTDAISRARLRIYGNKDVIAYPVNASITSPMAVRFYESYISFGSCYVIKLNNATSGTFTFNVSGTPSPNTYSAGMDSAGSYKSIVTITVTPKA